MQTKARQEKEQWAKNGMYSVLCKVCMALGYQKVKKHLGSSSVIQISLRDYQLNHKKLEENAFIFKSN